MKGFVVFLIAICLAAANGDSAAPKSNQQDAKNAQQTYKASDLQTASTHGQKVQIAQAQVLANIMANPNSLDKPSRHIQLQNAQFFDQDLSSQLHSSIQDSQQLYSLNQGSRQLHNLNQDPRQLHNLNQDPRQMNNLNQDPRQLHNLNQDPRQMNNLNKDPRQLHNLNQDPRQMNNLNQDPQQLHTLNQDSQPLRNLNQDSQILLHNLNQDPRQLHNLNQDSQLHNLKQDPQQLQGQALREYRRNQRKDVHSYNQIHGAQLHSSTLEEQFRNRNRAVQGQQQVHQSYGQTQPTAQQLQFEDQEQNQHRLSVNQVRQYSLQDEQYQGRAQLRPSGSVFPKEQPFPIQGQMQFIASRPSQDQVASNTFGSHGVRNTHTFVSSSRVHAVAGDVPAEQLYSSTLYDQDGSYKRRQGQRMLGNQGSFYGRETGLKVTPASGKGMQPVQLPGISHLHSSSILVSSLKSLPSLPALVYSTGAPSNQQVLAYGRPWHQGGAYVRQHWQTPHARYVYSHLL